LRVRHVVNHGEKEQGQGERDGNRKALSKGTPQTGERERGERGTQKYIGRIEGFLGQVAPVKTPVVGPHVQGAAQGHYDKPPGVVADELNGLMFLFRNVGDLSHLLVFLPLRLVIGRMQAGGHPVPSVPVVANAQLQAESVAKWNDLMKSAVVAQEPGREHGKESQRSQGCGQKPALPATMQPVAKPNPKGGQDRKHNGFGQGGQTIEQAKPNPRQKAG